MTHLFKIRELAEIGRVNEATLRRAVADGRLEAVRIGRVLRVREEAFSRFLKPVVPSEKPNGGYRVVLKNEEVE